MKRRNLLLMFTAIVLTTTAFIPFSPSKIKDGTNIGDKAPEIVFNDPNGNPIALSSLKGKIVLIDFWASWCGPCRKENPYVVNAYNKYKNQKFEKADGFTIFSVSLDADAAAWKKAIQADNLLWSYHVSDLKGWSSEPARRYGVSSIPNNFLINGDGIIVAKYLRGAQLDAALEKLKAKATTAEENK